MKCPTCIGEGYIRARPDKRADVDIVTELVCFGVVTWVTVICPDCDGIGRPHGRDLYDLPDPS